MERLAPATPEVDVPLVAALARLGHPVLAAEPAKALRLVPGPTERSSAHVRELETVERLRAVARQSKPVGRDDDEPPRPTIHARLAGARVVVRHHEADFH